MADFLIFLDLPIEFHRTLADNAISIEDLLHRQEIHQPITFGALPETEESPEHGKTLVPILLATSIGAASLLYTLSNILETIYHRPFVLEWDELEEIKENGRILKNEDGTPLMKVVRKHNLIQPDRMNVKHELEMKADTKGIVFRVKVQLFRAGQDSKAAVISDKGIQPRAYESPWRSLVCEQGRDCAC